MTLSELACDLNPDLISGSELTPKVCFEEIREKISGAAKMTNLQLLLLATIVSNRTEFQEKVLIEFLHDSN